MNVKRASIALLDGSRVGVGSCGKDPPNVQDSTYIVITKHDDIP